MTLETRLADIARTLRQETERGTVAQYIPELGAVDPEQFGIAVSDAAGNTVAAGDADTPFSIQSISKVFTLSLALLRHGDALWTRVGQEPSGNAFNSIVQLEAERGIPRNPLINAGAIVIADTLLGPGGPGETLRTIQAFTARAAGLPTIPIDTRVAASEARTGARNRSLAQFMAAEKTLHHPVETVLEAYFGHCALAMSCRTLARAGRYLAFDGASDGAALIPGDTARQIGALMLTCGHYDGSGAFACRVGLPGKSGVGGGILALVPGVASVAVWSPGLGPKGNSLLGMRALSMLAADEGWSVFSGLPVDRG
ncbi:MAG: glutaminase [Pseudomonadota bacterium]